MVAPSSFEARVTRRPLFPPPWSPIARFNVPSALSAIVAPKGAPSPPDALGTVQVKNKGGQFTSPTAAGVTAALAEAHRQRRPDPGHQLHTDQATAYPISTTTYLLFYKAGPRALATLRCRRRYSRQRSPP